MGLYGGQMSTLNDIHFAFSDQVSSLSSRIQLLGKAGWPASTRDPPVSMSPILGLPAHSTVSGFLKTYTLGIKPSS